MPKNDPEVFALLRSFSDTAPEVNFIAYALYAFEKYQWQQEFERGRGKLPTPDEVDRWIGDITGIRFLKLREEASRLFDSAARDYLASDIEAQKQEAVRTSILAEVKAAGSFWKQMAIALITAILAPIIIGAIIAAALTYDRVALTATDMSHTIATPGPTSADKSPHPAWMDAPLVPTPSPTNADKPPPSAPPPAHSP